MGTRKLDGLTFQSLRPGAETGAPLLQKKREEAPKGLAGTQRGMTAGRGLIAR